MLKYSPYNGQAETSRGCRNVTTLVFPLLGPSCCYVLCRSMRGNKVRRMAKQQINKLSLWQVLTVIDWQVILLTSILVVGRQGAVSWDNDSDVLCTHRSVFICYKQWCCSRALVCSVYLICCSQT